MSRNKNKIGFPGSVADSQLASFFVKELKSAYGAERMLVKALPKLSRAATSEGLKQALEDHLTATEQHVKRLEQVFTILEIRSQAKKSLAMEGIVDEGSEVTSETESGTMTRDAAIIMAAQKAEHYEIATYGGLIQLANTLAQEEVASILTQTLEEEKDADQLLTEIAEANVNIEASEESGE